MACDEKTEVLAGSTVVLLARVVRSDLAYAQITDVASVGVFLVDQDDDEDLNRNRCYLGQPAVVLVPILSPSPADVVFDSLQTDARWGRRDSLGYNVAVKLGMPTVAGDYDCRISLTMSNGDVQVVRYSLDVE
ncbi:MAG: hypothetical protein ACRYGG_21070 [Janthinobacterium lividum]